jgi:uncharacterized OsmC-like protein
MSGDQFRIELTHLDGYEFRLKFDWDNVGELTLDEPAPLGAQHGPNASRLLAAAVANCLTASLLFCLRKAHAEPRGLRTVATGRYTRNDKGRLRIGDIEVTITLDTDNSARLARCNELFEDYCVVTESVRHGLPVRVRVVDSAGNTLHEQR